MGNPLTQDAPAPVTHVSPPHRPDAGTPGMGGRVSGWCVLAAAVACVGVPGYGVARSVAGGLAEGRVGWSHAAPSWGLLASTLGWCVGIGVLSALLALPAGWWLGRRRGSESVWAGLLLLFPSYLTYAAFNMGRAPGTWTGDAIARLSERGMPDLPVLAGRVIAAGGLAVWAWAIPAFIIAWGVRALPGDALDALRLDLANPVSRAWHAARMVWRHAAGGAGVVALVMAGSAVPLHLADAPTYSVRVWLELTLSPGSPGAWVSAWPLLLSACVGAWWLGGRVGRVRPEVDEVGGGSAPSRWAGAWFWWMVVLGGAVPVGMLAKSLTGTQPLAEFWALSGASLGMSALSATGTGIVGGWLCAMTWLALCAGGSRRVVRWACVLWLVGALTPGVLVGQALATAWSGWDAWLDSPFAPAAACVVRYGAVGVVAGIVLAGLEGRHERDQRRIDGLTGTIGFLRVTLVGRGAGIAGAGLAVACLSLHEVESSVLLHPPGRPSFAQTLLGYLHFWRMDDLAAAVLWVLLPAGVLGGLAAWLLGRAGVHPGRRGGCTIAPEAPS